MTLLKAYLTLSKIRIVLLVLVTAVIGYMLAGESATISSKLIMLMIGMGLASAGGSALNQYIEKDE